MSSRGKLETIQDLRGIYETPERFTAGFAIGIIAVHLIYPKMPGNVANATTYPFPVLYKEVGESVNIGDALCAVYVGNNINYLDPLDAFVIE